MVRSSIFSVAAGCIFLLAWPAGPATVADPATRHLDRAVELLLAPAPTSQDLRAGFLSLLDAPIAAVPDTPSAAACGPKLTRARQVASGGSILDDQSAALLHECFRDAHGGTPFRVPDSIRSGSNAVDYCRAQLKAARALLQSGRRGEAFDRMIETAVLIVTPVERGAGQFEAWIWRIGRQWWAAARVFFVERFGWLSTARSSSSG